MNTLAAAATNQLGTFPGIAEILTTPLPVATPSGSGFLNLINLLLGSIEPAVNADTPETEISALAQSMASPGEIAQALIRSMLGEGLKIGSGESEAPSAARAETEDLVQTIVRKQKTGAAPVTMTLMAQVSVVTEFASAAFRVTEDSPHANLPLPASLASSTFESAPSAISQVAQALPISLPLSLPHVQAAPGGVVPQPVGLSPQVLAARPVAEQTERLVVVRTVLVQAAANQAAVNQTTLNQTTLSEITLSETTLNETAAGQIAANQTMVSQTTMSQRTVSQRLVSETTAPGVSEALVERIPAVSRPILLVPVAPLPAPVQAESVASSYKPDSPSPEPLVKSQAGTKQNLADPQPMPTPRAELAFGAKLTPLPVEASGVPIRIGAPKEQCCEAPSPQAPPQRPNTSEQPAPAEPPRLSWGDASFSNAKVKPPTLPHEDPRPHDSAAPPASGPRGEHISWFTQIVDDRSPAPPALARTMGGAPETPFHATAEAIRTAEPLHVASPVPRSFPAQEITVRLAPPDSPAVDLRVIQRAGQLQVAVRTPDPALQTSLRQDLGTLVNSMERAGYHAETFAPREAAVSKVTLPEMNSHGDRHESKPDFSGRGSGESHHGRQQQRHRDSRRHDWLTELEKQP